MSKTALIAITGLALAATTSIAAASSGKTVWLEGAGGLVPPVGTGGDGAPDSVFSSSVEVLNSGAVKDVTVVLTGMTHSWVGDLVATLTGPGGQSMTFLNRTGQLDPLDAFDFGDSSNLGGDYSFNDAFAGDMTATAVALTGTDDVIPGGEYAPEDSLGAPSSFVATFGGLDKQGVWTLEIEDFGGGDFGDLVSWTLHVDAVPAPGAAGLLVLGGLAGIRRRR